MILSSWKYQWATSESLRSSLLFQRLQIHSKTATSDESSIPLLVHDNYSIFDSDEELALNFGEGNGIEMASVKETSVTSAVETSQETSSGYYHKSADEEIHNVDGDHVAPGSAGGPYEMRHTEDESPEELDEVIEAIESKKKVWYAYLTTWDFWIVVILGYARPFRFEKVHLANYFTQ